MSSRINERNRKTQFKRKPVLPDMAAHMDLVRKLWNTDTEVASLHMQATARTLQHMKERI